MRVGARSFAAAAALLFHLAARADDPFARGFDPDPSRPALGIDSGFAVETAVVPPRGSWRGEFLLDYARGLLALRSGDQKLGDLISARLSSHLLGAYSLGFVEIGLDLPVAMSQSSNLSLLTAPPPTGPGVSGPLVAPIAASALGDLRLVARAPILDAGRWPVALSAVLDLRAPTGDGKAFYSDGPAAIPGLVATANVWKLRADAQLGYLFRQPGQYAQLVVHDGVTYALGASMALPPLSPAWHVTSWRALVDLAGQWPRGDGLDTARYRAPLSARAGIRAQIWRHLGVDLGVGTGIGEAGYGRESFRIFAGLRWDEVRSAAALEGDRDGDGVPDDEDACPDVPGTREMDGCPDTDHDGIPDSEDRCPTEPGPPQNDGCPIGNAPVVEIETDRISLKDAINFDTGKDTLKPESNHILDEIGAVLKSHPELKRIRVEGHTDNVGGASYNKDLSQRRAQTVVRYLVDHGVAKERLISAGYGFERPVAKNTSALGRAKNRRVEFTIMQESGEPGASAK